MTETKRDATSGSPAGPREVEAYVFLNEYNFRVEPGFAVANRGDVLVIENFTRSELVVTFPAVIREQPLRVGTGKPEKVPLGENLPYGFYPYTVSVEIGGGQKLEALGGSGPGVIIRR